MRVPPKPVPPVDILTSDKAANDYDAALEGYAEGLRLQIARICRWAEANGAKGLDCPAS